MKEINEYEKDLASIRNLMERSVKFISLSGLSGILAGVYALIGSCVGYFIIYDPRSTFSEPYLGMSVLFFIAAIVLICSIGTGCWLSWQKAKKIGVPIWNTTSKQLLIDLLIPLGTGGLFILILIAQEYYLLLSPMSLIFYGLALNQSSRSTFREIRYLGATEIILGITSALLPGYGLVFWAIGFGLMHVIYGAVMYFRYDR